MSHPYIDHAWYLSKRALEVIGDESDEDIKPLVRALITACKHINIHTRRQGESYAP